MSDEMRRARAEAAARRMARLEAGPEPEPVATGWACPACTFVHDEPAPAECRMCGPGAQAAQAEAEVTAAVRAAEREERRGRAAAAAAAVAARSAGLAAAAQPPVAVVAAAPVAAESPKLARTGGQNERANAIAAAAARRTTELSKAEAELKKKKLVDTALASLTGDTLAYLKR